jgi:hypothetical protein
LAPEVENLIEHPVTALTEEMWMVLLEVVPESYRVRESLLAYLACVRIQPEVSVSSPLQKNIVKMSSSLSSEGGNRAERSRILIDLCQNNMNIYIRRTEGSGKNRFDLQA